MGRGFSQRLNPMNKEILKVWGINGATLGTVTMADAEATLKVALLAATLFYTLIKCWKLARQKSHDDTIVFKKDDK